MTDLKEETDQNEDEDEGREEGGRTKDELAFLRVLRPGDRSRSAGHFMILGLQRGAAVGI